MSRGKDGLFVNGPKTEGMGESIHLTTGRTNLMDEDLVLDGRLFRPPGVDPAAGVGSSLPAIGVRLSHVDFIPRVRDVV